MFVAKQPLKTEKSPLVYKAKNSSPQKLETIDQKDFEHIAEKYRAQDIARQIFWEYSGQVLGTDPSMSWQRMNMFPTTKCRRVRHNRDLLTIYRSQNHHSAFYGGLVTCGSVWACPVCASKIQSRRTIEIQKAFYYAYTHHLKVVMVTYTFPHQITDNIEDLLAKHNKILKRFRSGKGYQRFKKKIGYIGLIRGLEVTYGTSGFHPHTHELLLVDENADEEYIREYLSNNWEKLCVKYGLVSEEKLEDFRRYGIDFIFRAKSSDYIAKQNNMDWGWGADREVATSNSKTGRKSGRHPFQILLDSEKNPADKKIFVKYALAFKGKHQVDWSKGLKDLVGVKEKTDQELADEQTDQADVLAILNYIHWNAVLSENARADILHVALTDGFEGLKEWFLIRGIALDPPD